MSSRIWGGAEWLVLTNRCFWFFFEFSSDLEIRYPRHIHSAPRYLGPPSEGEASEKVLSGDEMMHSRQQRSGTCTWRSLQLVVKYILVEGTVTDVRPVARLVLYKLFILDLKLDALNGIRQRLISAPDLTGKPGQDSWEVAMPMIRHFKARRGEVSVPWEWDTL